MAAFSDITNAVPDPGRVPGSCTLPPVDQPIRIAQFDALIASAVCAVEPLSPTSTRFLLDPDAAGRARELAAREVVCCSFSDFTFATDPNGLVAMVVTVPSTHAEVLAAWTARAATVVGPDRD